MGGVAIDPGFFRLSGAIVRAADGRRAHRDVLGYMHQTSERNLRVRTPVTDVVSYMQRRHDLKIAQAEVIYATYRDRGSGLTSAELWLANDKANRRKKDNAYKRNAGRMPRLGVFLTASFPYGVTRATAVAALECFLDYLEAEFGCAAEAVIHDKNGPDHCHILITDRFVDEHGVGGKNRLLNGVAAKAEGHAILDGDKMLAPAMEGMRSQWAVLMREIAPEGTRTIDHRSFARRGIDLEPVTVESHASIREQKAEGDEYWLERRERELSARETAIVEDARTFKARAVDDALEIKPLVMVNEVETPDPPRIRPAGTEASRAPPVSHERMLGRVGHGGTARRSAASRDRPSRKLGIRQHDAAAAVAAFTAHTRRQTNPLPPDLGNGDAARSAGKTTEPRQSALVGPPTSASIASKERVPRRAQPQVTLRPVVSEDRVGKKSSARLRDASAAVLALTARKQRQADEALVGPERRDTVQPKDSRKASQSVVSPVLAGSRSTKPSSPASRSTKSGSTTLGDGRIPFANRRKTETPAIPALIISGLNDLALRSSKTSSALLSLALKSIQQSKTLEAAAAMLPLVGIGLRRSRRRSENQSVLAVCALLARKRLEAARAAIAGLAAPASKLDAAIVANPDALTNKRTRPVSADYLDVNAEPNKIGSRGDAQRSASPASGVGTMPSLKPRATMPDDAVAHEPAQRTLGGGPRVTPAAQQDLTVTVLHAGPVEARLDGIVGRDSRSESQHNSPGPAQTPHNTGKPSRGPDEGVAKAPEPTGKKTLRGQNAAAGIATSTVADVTQRPDQGRQHIVSRAPSRPASGDGDSSRASKTALESLASSGDAQSGAPSARIASEPPEASPSQEKLALLYAAALYKDRRWRREWSAELATAFGIDAAIWEKRIDAEYRRLFVEAAFSAAEVKKLAKAEATSVGAADLIRMFDSWAEVNRDNRVRRVKRTARKGSSLIGKGSDHGRADGIEDEITDKR